MRWDHKKRKLLKNMLSICQNKGDLGKKEKEKGL